MNSHWLAPEHHPRLASGEAHVWAVSLDPTAVAHDPLAAILSPEERKRAADFRLVTPRQRFVLTRAALRILLSRYLGIAPANVAFTVDANNKPRLADIHGVSGLRFNVAHSDKLALIATTVGHEIGIDVERLRPVRHAEHIARRYFHPVEIAAIAAATPSGRDATFLRCWTGKEAVLKALGTGITGTLSAFHVLDDHDVERGLAIDVPTASPQHAQCWLRWLDPNDEYVAAVAVAGPRLDLRCMTFAP